MASVKHGLFERPKNPVNFYIMTMNTAGPDKSTKRANVVKAILDELKQGGKMPSIIFIQEPLHVELDFSKLDIYSYAYTAEEAAHSVWNVWNNAEFVKIIHIDAKLKEKMRNEAPYLYPAIGDRFSGVLLIHKVSGYRVLAVSWHGPSNEPKEEQPRIRRDFLAYMWILRKILDPEHYEQIHILIGGDFNVKFDDTFMREQYEHYKASPQTFSRTIDYFVHTISNDINVTDTQHIYDALQTPYEEIKHNIVSLDHDPILASVSVEPNKQGKFDIMIMNTKGKAKTKEEDLNKAMNYVSGQLKQKGKLPGIIFIQEV